MVANSKDDIGQLTEDVLREEYPELWANTPRPVRELIHARVRERLPRIADEITEEIGENIDELLDINLMITSHLDENPELLNRLFLEVGDRELKFIVNSGFLIGGLLGFLTIPLFLAIDSPFVLPVAGVLVGYMTNWIALKIIFLPIEERRLGPFRLQGLFIKRQPEVAETYAEIVADEIVTIGNVAENLMYGSQSDRTRKMIRDSIRPEVDRAVGIAGPAIRRLITDRIGNLPPVDFVGLLRPAFVEDEWMLILLGAVLGFVAGWIQLAVVTAA